MKNPSAIHALLLGASFLAVTNIKAATLYWDGGTVNIAGDGNGVSLGTAGNWSESLFNWDAGTSPYVAWNNTNSDTAVFSGTAGTVTLTSAINVGGLQFYTTGYNITASPTNTLSFSGDTAVNLYSVAAATITGNIGSTAANMTFNALNPFNAGTITFNGTSAGGWSGTTRVNPSMTLSLAASNQALLNTSGITLNGSNILLTNTATGSENTINRVSDTAAITSYGASSISIANTSTNGRQYSETIGSVTHNNGQLSIGFTTIQNGTAPSTQTLLVGGLTNSGTTSTIAINGGGTGAGAIHGNSIIRVNGITTSTAANEIIGPWITAGTGSGAQSDWAVYQSNGVSGLVVSRNIAASPQTAWTSSSATGNYTAANANPLTSTANNRLTADRFVNTLRATFAETNASSGANWNINTATDTITFGSHALTNGDVVAFRTAPTGLTENRPYYVINAAPGTFQLSLTPGGGVLDLTAVQGVNSFMATGLNLNGNTLGMNGYITGTTGVATIGGGSASTITLPTATSGNLYLHGATNIWIDPSIKDNGAGVLTLVKSGTNTVTLSGNNTYTGGTVVNAGNITHAGTNTFATGAAGADVISGGSLTYSTLASWGGAGRNVRFTGTGSLNSTVDGYNGGTLTVDATAVAQFTTLSSLGFATTTGSGTIRGVGGQNKTLNLGNADTFTGNVELAYNANNTSGVGTPHIQFSALNDAVGSSIKFYRQGGGTDSGQTGQIALAGNGGSLTFDNRQIQLLPRVGGTGSSMLSNYLLNNNTTAAHNWVINTNLLNEYDRAHNFSLAGGNLGDNRFNGTIGNSTFGAFALSLVKEGAGRWGLGGANTYTGTTTVAAGTLEVTNLANGGSASSLGASSNAAANLVLSGGTLRYAGAATSSNRGFTLSANSTIDASGTGALNLTNTATPAYGTTNAVRTLTLTGSNKDENTLAASLANNGTGAVGINKIGIGTWVLNGANTNTGNTSVSGGGKLILDYGTSDTNKIAGVLTLQNGGGDITLRGGSHLEAVSSLAMSTGGGHTSISRDGGSAKIDLGAITRQAEGGVTLSLAEDSLASTTSAVVNGILTGGITVGSNWAKKSGSDIIALSAGDYTTLTAAATTNLANHQLTGTLSRGAISGINSLRIVGSGTDDILTITSGNLTLSPLTGGTLGDSAAGGILYVGGGNDNYTITGSGNIAAANANRELIIHTYTGTLTLDMTHANSGAPLTKAGLGTLVLTKSNTYTGATRVNQGVLQLRNDTAAGTTAGGIFVGNNAALELANAITVGAEALTITGAGVSNGGALRNVASNTSSYAGALTIGTGGARINSDSSGALTLSGGVVTSLFNNVTFGGAGNTTVSTAAISGAGGLVKDGLGTTILSATNTYSGATTVSNGILVINGTGSINNSSVTINGGNFRYNSSTAYNGALTLTSGTISGTNWNGSLGNQTIATGDIVSPGNSPGTATTTGQTWAAGGTYEWEINSISGSAGLDPGWDLISGTGTLNITATAGNEFTIDITSLTLGNLAGNVSDFNDASNYSWLIAEFATITGFDTTDFILDDSAFANIYTGTFGLSFNDGATDQIFLTYTAIPEPGAALLGGLGVLLLLRRRR